MKSIQKSSELCQIRPEPPPSLTFRRRSKSMSRRPSVKGLRFTFLYNFDELIFALSFKDYCYKRLPLNKTNLLIFTIAETHFALNCGHRPKLSVASQEDAQKPYSSEIRLRGKTLIWHSIVQRRLTAKNEHE